MVAGRHLMISGLLAAMVSSIAVMAEINPLSEAELEGVSARGVQIAVQLPGAAEQNINNDSVQANDVAEEGASGMAITNSASSGVNVGQNMAGEAAVISADITQTNTQTATNSETSLQAALQLDIDFDSIVSGDRQNINNGSTQINDDAQSFATGMAITNAASSAVNVGQNIASSVSLGDSTIRQVNDQQNAGNSNLNAQGGVQVNADTTSGGLFFTLNADRQNINNGSTQLNDNAQTGASGMAITNAASSAANVGQNIAGSVSMFADAYSVQDNMQTAQNSRTNAQLAGQLDVEFDAGWFWWSVTVDRQNINNGSTQLNDNAQSLATGMAITNSASSAANIAQNVAGDLSIFDDAAAIQRNVQNATNSAANLQLAGQADLELNFNWAISSDRQNINNGSTQLNDEAQIGVNAMALTNSASSAVDVGQNVAAVSDGDIGAIVQRNTQVALNSGLNAQGAIQIDADLGTTFGFGDQHVNNGSTQLNDYAQENVNAMAITNSASSALNVAQNVANILDGWIGARIQTNNQVATNTGTNLQGSAQADIDVFAFDFDMGEQNINNGSVQLNDDAQMGISAMAATNSASSALNVGQNIASLGLAPGISFVDQENVQTATLNMLNGQAGGQADIDVIAINYEAANQNINNGSVQLNSNAQRNANALALTNSASSAVNVGQNLAAVAANWVGDIDQLNDQTASSTKINAQLAGQAQIEILTWTIDLAQTQNINNGSVQLSDNAQQNASGMAITNAASSAVNVGQNIAGVASGFIGSITQNNLQTATNW
jgi:hypothetical protein